jgi:hypothetical protein
LKGAALVSSTRCGIEMSPPTAQRAIPVALLEVETPSGLARVRFNQARHPIATLVLGHGAGRGVEATDLAGLARDLPARGVTVCLVEQPWRVAGRRVADRPALLDDAWLAVVAELERIGLRWAVGRCPSGGPNRPSNRSRRRAGVGLSASPAGACEYDPTPRTYPGCFGLPRPCRAGYKGCFRRTRRIGRPAAHEFGAETSWTTGQKWSSDPLRTLGGPFVGGGPTRAPDRGRILARDRVNGRLVGHGSCSRGSAGMCGGLATL